MNKKLKIFLIILSLFILGGFLTWKYINKATVDYSKKEADYTFTFDALIKKMETDTSNLRNKLIAINGPIKKVIKDSNSVSLEIGYDSIMSSITCQIDNRHLADFENVVEGNKINIKGMVSGLNISEESLFGNTLEMTYCTLLKK